MHFFTNNNYHTYSNYRQVVVQVGQWVGIGSIGRIVDSIGRCCMTMLECNGECLLTRLKACSSQHYCIIRIQQNEHTRTVHKDVRTWYASRTTLIWNGYCSLSRSTWGTGGNLRKHNFQIKSKCTLRGVQECPNPLSTQHEFLSTKTKITVRHVTLCLQKQLYNYT